MLRTALKFIQSELAAYMLEKDPALYSEPPGNETELSGLVTPGGNLEVNTSKHICISLLNVEEERFEGKRPYYVPTEDNNFRKLNPPVALNLHLLFTATQSDYLTALRDLSYVISFFQSNPIFDEQKYPSLNASVNDPINKPWQLIEKLTFRLHNTSFEQQNNIWAMLGGKYIPSVVYKMSMITVFETKSKEQSPAITELNFKEN